MSQLREGRRRRRLGRPRLELLALSTNDSNVCECICFNIPIIRKTGFPFCFGGFGGEQPFDFAVVDDGPPLSGVDPLGAEEVEEDEDEDEDEDEEDEERGDGERGDDDGCSFPRLIANP